MSGIGWGTTLYDHPSRKTTPMTAYLLRRVLAGWSPKAVAAASDGAITVRTVYRWRAAILSVEAVQLGPWVADFAIRRNGPPLRVSDWRQVDS